MNAIQRLLTEHIDIWTAADTEKKSGRGRASSNAGSVYGIRKLRELILELAMRGKLDPQDASDEPATELLKRIQVEKSKLIAEGKIKKDKPLPSVTEDEKPFAAPQGWCWVRLGNALLKITDGTHRSPTNIPVGDFKYISAKNIKPWGIDLSDVTYVTKDVHDEIYGRCDPVFGDILYIKDGATTGIATTNTLDEPFSMLSSVALLKPSAGTNNQFLLKAMTAPFFYAEMRSEMTGVAITRVTLAKLNDAIIPLPPLAEQHRIVAKVDELMALCDQLEAQHINAVDAHEKLVSHLLGTLTQSQSAEDFSANWQCIAAHFDTLFTTEVSIDSLKQTLLQLAVMGKLVPQDASDEPASELLKRIQVKKSKLIADGKIKKDKALAPMANDEHPFVLPNGWKWARLSEVTTGMDSGWSPACLENSSPSDAIWGVLKTTAVQVMQYLEHENKELPGELVPRPEAEVKAGDILFTRAGPTNRVAISCLVQTTRPKLMISDKIIRFHPVEGGIDGRFMTLCLNTGATAEFLENVKSGMAASQVNISQEKLRLAPIPMPPVALQHRIVAKVDELMALCEQLKSRLTDAKQLQQKLADVMIENNRTGKS
jgi:type I restriction enzyme S subunit